MPRRFRFTLEAVHTLRQRAEQQALETYAGALLHRHRALEQLDRAEHDFAVNCSLLNERAARGCAAGEWSQLRQFNRSLEAHRRAAAQALAEAEREVNAALGRLLQARQQREVVDKLHERQRQHFDRELAREERRELDDLVARRGSWRLSELQPEERFP